LHVYFLWPEAGIKVKTKVQGKPPWIYPAASTSPESIDAQAGVESVMWHRAIRQMTYGVVMMSIMVFRKSIQNFTPYPLEGKRPG